MRYEIRTLPIGQDFGEDDEFVSVIEVLNVRPELNQFRALVEVISLTVAVENNDAGVWAGEEE